jgi:hypothetical protein
MTGPVEGYLRQLRASLRTPPGETSRILAEAEDHLAESRRKITCASRWPRGWRPG